MAENVKAHRRIAIAICSRRFVPDGGGTEQHTHRLAVELASREHQVTVVTGRYKGRPSIERANGFLIRRLFVGAHVPVLHEVLLQLSFLWYLIRHSDEYEIVQLSHSQLSVLTAVLVGRFSKKPVVARNSTAGAGGDLASWSSVPLGAQLLRWTLERVNAAVAVSAVTGDEFLAAGVPEQRIQLIENGVEVGGAGRDDADSLRRELGLRTGAFVVLFIGRLVPVKAPGDLIDAWLRFAKRHGDTQLVFLGEGELEDDLRAQIVKSGQVENAILAGRVNNVNEYLLAADVFVLPSVSEAMPNALLEAMAAGLPVIASAVGGILDVVDHGENGLLYSPGDTEGLGNCLLAMARSPEQRTRFGENARQTIIDRFSLERMTDRYVGLYQALLSSI